MFVSVKSMRKEDIFAIFLRIKYYYGRRILRELERLEWMKDIMSVWIKGLFYRMKNVTFSSSLSNIFHQ